MQIRIRAVHSQDSQDKSVQKTLRSGMPFLQFTCHLDPVGTQTPQWCTAVFLSTLFLQMIIGISDKFERNWTCTMVFKHKVCDKEEI